MTSATVLGISIQTFLLCLLSSTDQVPPPTTVNIFLFVCLSVCFFCWCFYNHKPFIIVCLKCQLMMFYHAHIYICTAQKTADSVTFTEETLNGQPHFLCTDIYAHILTYTLAHTHTYTYKMLPAVKYSCHLVISKCHKSYQQYFDILLNYK